MVAVSYSPFRTGSDIEYVNTAKVRGNTAVYAFSPDERDYIAAGGSAAPDKRLGEGAYSDSREKIKRFYRIWVLKECFLKTRGLSVFDMPKAPVFASADGLFKTIDIPFSFYLYELGDDSVGRYTLAVSQESGPCGPPLIRWFSDPLPLRNIAEIKAVLRPVNTESPKI
jgi:hypothetical protein